MAFIVRDVPDITVQVLIEVPGESDPSSITATWRLHNFDVATAKIEQMQSGEITDEQLVEADLISAGPFLTPDNEEIPFTPELAQQLLNKIYVRKPLLQSWFTAQNGRGEAAVKN